jgi:hypothetical protein
VAGYARPVTVEPILGHPKGFAVVVTSNRMKLLTRSLTMLGAQIRAPDVVGVVDNVSTDGSHDVIRAQFPDVDPVTSTRNTGNSDFELTARILSHRKGTYPPQVIAVHQIAELDTIPVDRRQRCYHEVGNKIWALRSGEAFAPAQAGHDLEPHW